IIPGQERRGELGRRAFVTATLTLAAAFVLAPRATIAITAAAFASRSAVTVAAAAFAASATAAAAFTTGSTVAVTPAAATMTIAARPTVAAFTRLSWRTGIGKLLAGLLIDQAHRQADLAALVDLEQLDLHFLALGEDVADVLDPLVLDLRDVDQPVLAGHVGHERAEIDDARHLAGVDLADLGLGGDAADPLARGLDLRQIGGRELDHALVVDVDLGAGGCDDLADHLAAGADDFADLVLGD